MEVWIWNIPRSDPLQGTFFVLQVEPWNIPDPDWPDPLQGIFFVLEEEPWNIPDSNLHREPPTLHKYAQVGNSLQTK